MDPSDLSRPGWVHYPEMSEGDRMVLGQDGTALSRLDGVVPALDAVHPFDLPHVRSEDRSFVASEMTAFLRSWLLSVDCPVLDRPIAESLSGPAGCTSTWSQASRALGVPDRRHAPIPRFRSHRMTVIGDHVFGRVTEAAASLAIAMTREAGAVGAHLTIGDDGEGAELYAAEPWWCSGHPGALGALLSWISQMARARRRDQLSPAGSRR
jgi:hypothetical protein